MSLEPVRGVEPPLPAWARSLPAPDAALTAWQALRREWEPVEAAVVAMAGRGEQKQQREALLKVHQRLVELGQARGTPYATAFEAYMLHAGGRLEQERGADAAAAALLGAVVFAIDAQQEAGAPAALRSMLAPAASVAAAVLQHAAVQQPPPRLALSGLMAALAGLLLDCAKLDLVAFTADLATAEAALRCAVAAGLQAAARGTSSNRAMLWGELLPAAFKAIRKMDDMDEHGLLSGERWAFVQACGALLGLALSATENPRLDISLAEALAPLDRAEVAQGAVTLAHQLGCCYRDRLSKDPPPDEATQARLRQVLRWLSKALQLLSLLLQHGGQMEAFLDDGGVMSLCLHLSKYPAIHAALPPGDPAHAVDCQVVELLTYALNNSKRARELLSEGDQGGGGHGIKILLAALGAAPGLQALLADAVVHRDMARWTFKRSLLKCLEAAVLTTSDHRKEILANDGVGVIVRSCRWRPHEPGFRPKQEAQLVRANPAFVRGIAGNAFSCLCIASQNLDDDKSYWNQVASKLAEATSADELMSFHKWMPGGQDTAQALLNADKLSCSWGLHTALWRLLHPLTYNNKEQRAVFAASEGYICTAAAALSLPNSDEALTKGRVCAFKPTVMYILYNAAIIDDACRKQQLQLGVHERALELLCQSFQMAGEQDRRILKAAATSKRNKGAQGGGAASAQGGSRDAKTFQAGVGGQADAASLLLEGLLLKSDADTRALCRMLVQQGKLAAVQKALNNRIGSSYSESTLQTAERSFLKVLRHAELAVSEQRQQHQQAAASEAERLAAELLAAEEAAAAKSAARAAKQQQRQRAAKAQAAAAAAKSETSSGGSTSEDEAAAAAEATVGKDDGGGGAGGSAPAPPPAAGATANGGDGGQQLSGEQQRQEREEEAQGKASEQQQGYQKLLQEWEAAEAATAAEAAAAVAAKKRSKKAQQREKAREKKAAAKAASGATSAASTPVTSPKAASRPASSASGQLGQTGAKVIAVPLNGTRPGGAGAKAGSPGAARVAAARPPGGTVAVVPRPASTGAAAPPTRAGLVRQPIGASAGPPISFAAAAAAGTGQTVRAPPAALAAADAAPPTPPRPPAAGAAPGASRASTPAVASPLLLSPQQQALSAESMHLQHQQAAQQTPPRGSVLRTASAPQLPAMGVGASTPASAAPSVAASPQRSLFADMLQPVAPAVGASAPQSGAPSGVTSPTQSVHGSVPLPPGALPGMGGSAAYSFAGGLGGLLQQQQQQQPGGGGYMQQQQAQQAQQAQQRAQQQMGLGGLNPSALEAALQSKARGGGDDGLGLLPFAVAEAALFDDSPAAAHALPLAVADFVLGGDDFGLGGGGGGGGHGLRDSQDYSDMLGELLPGGSPLKPLPGKGGAPAAAPPVMNGAIHGRQASAGGDPGAGAGLFGAPMSQPHLSLAAAAAWGSHSAHSSLDSSGPGRDAPAPAASSGSSSSDVLLPGLGGRYDQRSTADSWLAKGRQLV